MRHIFFAMSLALLIMIAGASGIIGLGYLGYDIATGNSSRLMQDFQVFTLSSILFLVAVSSYMITKTMANTEALSDVAAKLIKREIDKGPVNPFQLLFQNMSQLPVITIDQSQFSSPEEFYKHRDEILAKGFNQKPTEIKQKLEQMTIEQLQAEERKAVENQEFELAAAIVSLIQDKKKAGN